MHNQNDGVLIKYAMIHSEHRSTWNLYQLIVREILS